MDLTTLGVIAAVLVPVAALILHALGILEKLSVWLGRAWRFVFRKSPATDPKLPARTIVAIPEPRSNALWWHMGSDGRQPPSPLMQICADFNVTNVWERDVKLAGAVIRFRRWLVLRRVERGDALVKDLRSPYSGRYAIPPNAMTHVRAHFMFGQPGRAEGKRLTADLALVDQFDNHHWIKRLRFDYR